jgi:hypothetical protein
MHNQAKHNYKDWKKSQGWLVGYTEACLDTKAMWISSHLALVDLQTPIGFALLQSPFSAPRDLPLYAKDDHN